MNPQACIHWPKGCLTNGSTGARQASFLTLIGCSVPRPVNRSVRPLRWPPTSGVKYRDRVRKMNIAPNEIENAKVICSTSIDSRHAPTRNCRHTVAGALIGPASGLAICQYDGEESYSLFYCDEDWNPMTDTCNATIEDAMNQAEFEYEGINSTWVKGI